MVESPSTGDAQGPAARLDLLAGHAVLLAATPGPDLAAAGYQETEYLASGTACGYRAADLPRDGRFRLYASDSASYTTRVVVRRPEDPAAFNGTLVVEWLNVSGGQDVAPEYTYVAAEVLRRGYAWAGISAQWIGVHGGPAAVGRDGAEQEHGSGLKDLDPDRYRSLHHPGDAYSYDIYTQISRALRYPLRPTDPTHGLAVRTILAVGESQSAATLSTYYNGVAPLSRLFDGFLIHSRMGAAAPLGRSAEPIGATELLNGEPTLIRSDLPTPVLMVQTETDLLGELAYLHARQPDSRSVKLWEVAGAAHADHAQIGELESMLGCPDPVNRGQQRYVLRAALRHLARWAGGRHFPPSAPRLAIDETVNPPRFVTDRYGNAIGGVRTPCVDVPVAVLSGIARPSAPRMCQLFGRTQLFTATQLHDFYPSVTEYLDRYRTAADAAIDAGFVLADDRDSLLSEAQPELFD